MQNDDSWITQTESSQSGIDRQNFASVKLNTVLQLTFGVQPAYLSKFSLDTRSSLAMVVKSVNWKKSTPSLVRPTKLTGLDSSTWPGSSSFGLQHDVQTSLQTNT